MNLLIHIDTTDPLPLYAQLERGICLAIATGQLTVGDQLPTVRQLAVTLRVNANTVAKVYTELERTGVLESRRGVGTFVRAAVSEDAAEAARHQQLGQLADRFLIEVARLGFSLPELLKHLQGKLNLKE
jgi:GntR family transcriptional regulator